MVYAGCSPIVRVDKLGLRTIGFTTGEMQWGAFGANPNRLSTMLEQLAGDEEGGYVIIEPGRLTEDQMEDLASHIEKNVKFLKPGRDGRSPRMQLRRGANGEIVVWMPATEEAGKSAKKRCGSEGEGDRQGGWDFQWSYMSILVNIHGSGRDRGVSPDSLRLLDRVLGLMARRGHSSEVWGIELAICFGGARLVL
jgi:hypothetical protein